MSEGVHCGIGMDGENGEGDVCLVAEGCGGRAEAGRVLGGAFSISEGGDGLVGVGER